MNKTVLNLVAKALRERTTQVRANKTWQMLHETENIGTPCADGYRLETRDFDHLQTIYARASKQSAEANRQQPEHADRMDMIAHYRNEKFARDVFAHELVFAAPQSSLPLKHGNVAAGIPDLLLVVPVHAVDIAGIHRLLIVENGTMLTRWHDWIHLLPEIWQSALLLYRGHGNNQRHVKNLVHDLSQSAQLAVYPDFDPAGLAIAAEYACLRRTAIVIPRHWMRLTRRHPANREDIFARQDTEKKNIFPQSLQPFAAHIRHERLAVMQESCLQTGELIIEDIT